MNFTSDVVIGLEIHVQLNTQTKLFCGCKSYGDDEPNSRCCQICLGHPGTRPVLNKKALEFASKFCLAVGSKIAPELIFSRKSYFYPDMSKNFQITQFEEPIGVGGKIKLKSGQEINLIRAHMEEDPASISYPLTMTNSSYCLINYNRSGNPLIEIVTEPELTSPDEARDFLNRLITILSYLKIFDINKGIIKADANISIKESGYTRVEIKNITGFKELEKALVSEVERQKQTVSEGKKIRLETRGWDSASNTTHLMRVKETEADYGYIIEPDLSTVDISDGFLDELKKGIPELAHQKAERFIKEMGVGEIDADVMAMELELAELFEKVAQKIDPKLAAKWMRKELLRVLNYNKKNIAQIEFDEKQLIELLEMVESNKISDTTAQKIMEELMEKQFSPKEYVEKNKLEQITDDSELREVCEKVISENSKAVEDFKAGGEKSLNFLVGQVMRLTKGKASPQVVSKIMMELID
jgi:aspartyl-tRNA(Asn)/glutamyl-tRNA(Gln) amidotransferase subunit B